MAQINISSDEALCKAAVEGDGAAEEVLIIRYAVLVRACSRPYFLIGGDSEDLMQEGMLGLLSAIRHYEPDRGTSFRTYAERCIRSRIVSAVRAAARFKHGPLNDSVSIESPQFDESISAANYLRNPEDLVIIHEITDELVSSDLLSKLEREVLGYYLQGLSYADIATRSGRKVKSVDNSVQRIRKKLAQYLD